MKIQVLTIQSGRHINTDCMGSFGLGCDFGGSLVSRAIGFAKAHGVNIPDLQAVYLATMLRDKGHDVLVANQPGNAEEYWIHTSINGCREEIRIAKKLSRVFFFGAMAAALPEIYEPYGRVIAHPESLFFEHIDDYPFPHWDFYQYRKFSYFPSLRRRPIVPMLASRGCRYKCSYCPYASHYGAWNPREVDRVIAEIVANAKHYGARGIIFRDPLFSADRNRTIELLCKMSKLPYKLDYACESRVENVDEEVLQLMQRAGFRAVHFGIESADAAVLNSVGRRDPGFAMQKKILDQCEMLGIRTNCFFILGFPADTVESVHRTITRACELNPNVAEFFIATPYPGTPLASTIETTLDYPDMTGYNLAFKHPVFSAGQLAALKDQAYRRFYFRRRWISKFLTMV